MGIFDQTFGLRGLTADDAQLQNMAANQLWLLNSQRGLSQAIMPLYSHNDMRPYVKPRRVWSDAELARRLAQFDIDRATFGANQ